MIFSLILNLPIKRPSVQKTLHSSAIRLVCSYRPTNRQYMYIYIFASQGLRFGSPFSPPLADLEYILRIRALIFHWLRLPVHVSNQKTFYTSTCYRRNVNKDGTECSHMTTICHFPFWFQWKHFSRVPKLWNFHLVDSKCFQIKGVGMIRVDFGPISETVYTDIILNTIIER